MKTLFFFAGFLFFIFNVNSQNTFPGSGNVGIGTTTPASDLHISSGTNGDAILILESDTDNNNESDNPLLQFRQDGAQVGVNVGFSEENFGGNVFGIGRRYSNLDFWDTFVINAGNGNIGIGTNTPRTKLQVNGSSESRSATIVSFGALSDSDFVTSNTYRSFTGSTYTDGTGSNIGKYFSYRSIYGGYSNYNNGGFGFYSQGHYPRMFMEVISGNHGVMSGLPSDSPIKNGYIYQQIKGPLGSQISAPIKATKDNSQWLWGVSEEGNIIVAGKIESREVKVTVNAGADFVFEDNYNLPTLEKVQQFIQENGHLPEIAPAKDMEENGIHLSEMNIKLLQKIEELTLYAIEQEEKLEKVKELENKVLVLEEENKVLKEMSAKLLEFQSRLEKMETKSKN